MMYENIEDRPFINASLAARVMGINYMTLRNWLRRGIIPQDVYFYLPNGRIGYRPKELRLWFESRTPTDPKFTLADAAEICCMSGPVLREWTKKGLVPQSCFIRKPTGHLSFNKKELENWASGGFKRPSPEGESRE